MCVYCICLHDKNPIFHLGQLHAALHLSLSLSLSLAFCVSMCDANILISIIVSFRSHFIWLSWKYNLITTYINKRAKRKRTSEGERERESQRSDWKMKGNSRKTMERVERLLEVGEKEAQALTIIDCKHTNSFQLNSTQLRPAQLTHFHSFHVLLQMHMKNEE